MTNLQRRENDRATITRRDSVDKIRMENRAHNDEVTAERRERQDKIRDDSRLKNDEMTSSRRKENDRNPWRTFAISLLIIAIIATGVYYYFFV